MVPPGEEPRPVGLEALGPDLGQIELDPLFAEYAWSGTFPEPELDAGSSYERRVYFDSHHRGPVTLAFHAGCSTQSTYEPLAILVYAGGETDVSRYLMAVYFGSFAARDYSENQVVSSGAYYARLVFVNQTRGGCPWSMTIRYPI